MQGRFMMAHVEVALRGWLARFPRFELAVDASELTWSIGPVRGPRHVPLSILESHAIT